MLGCTTSTTTLVVVQERLMMTGPSSKMKRMNTLNTSSVVKDTSRSRGGSHWMIDELIEGPVKVGEKTKPMVRGYIPGLDINQDTGRNIDKESGLSDP